MNRDQFLARIDDRNRVWDLIIVGGGATGLGAAIDAASRGYSTVLLEQSDFAKATSSRSTKLIHGGVRYLKQGNVSLVLGALRERGRLRDNAPHLVHSRAFVVPAYTWWEPFYYGLGLRIYDTMAGGHSFGRSKHLSRNETVDRVPTIEPSGLRGGTLYFDGQFDDARLAIAMARTAADHEAVVLNYVRVDDFIKENSRVSGVVAVDTETGRTYSLHAKVVVNATGPFSDRLRQVDDPDTPPMVQPSQGTHIVLDRAFLPSDTAVMVPKTDDGRILFAIPWHERVVVGTTDTPVAEAEIEPRPLRDELDFLLEHTARYLTKDPTPSDVLSAFAGLRPLVRADGTSNTAALSRDHTITVSDSGLVTITGGKWTTYRKMAEDVIDRAAAAATLKYRPCQTVSLRLHGYAEASAVSEDLATYGSEALDVQAIVLEDPAYSEPLHPDISTLAGEVIWAVRYEMARTVDDILARRTRHLLLDARKSMDMAPRVAALMAKELGRDAGWIEDQVRAYNELASGYLFNG